MFPAASNTILSAQTLVGYTVSDDRPSAKSSKRPKSVSTLTPAQLSRKRANDRAAQRAVRARVKSHIQRLEREIEDLRDQQDHRKLTVQNLLCHNKALESELVYLRECIGMRFDSSPNWTNAQSSSRGSGVFPYPNMTPVDTPVDDDVAPVCSLDHESSTINAQVHVTSLTLPANGMYGFVMASTRNATNQYLSHTISTDESMRSVPSAAPVASNVHIGEQTHQPVFPRWSQ